MRAKQVRRGRGRLGLELESGAETPREEDDRWDPPVSDGERRKGATRAGAEKKGCCWAEGSGDADEAGEAEGLQRTSAVGPR